MVNTSAATDTHTAIDELLEVVSSMQSILRLYNENQQSVVSCPDRSFAAALCTSSASAATITTKATVFTAPYATDHQSKLRSVSAGYNVNSNTKQKTCLLSSPRCSRL
jgi:hypothetical protein